jgi:hypothetical protein
MGIVDTLIVFRILKLLTTKWENQEAYKLGLIDKNGNRIKDKKPETSEERNALSLLHRLVFNVKRIIQKVPFGKTAFASYAVALALLKEETNLNAQQADELCEKFYKMLKENDLLEPEQISECANVGVLETGNTYRLKRQLKQNFDEHGDFKIYTEKTKVDILQEHSKIFGIELYVGYIGNDRVLVTEDDVY